MHVSALCSTTLAYLLITLGHKNHESLHFECGCAGSISVVTDVVNVVKMDLLYNLTGLNQEVYFAVNSAAYILLFLAISLPSLILCILCILALFFAKDVNWKMRALIINMFAAEICNWVAYSVLLLGFPTRFSGKIADNYSCKIALSLLVVAPQTKFAATALYSVMVYLLIRYGITKLKWSVIIVFTCIFWIAAFLIGLIPYFDDFAFNNAGFCEVDSRSLLFILVVGISVIVMFFATCTIIVFGVLTLLYIKRNTLEGNVEVKKSMARHLIFLSIVAVFAFVNNILPASFPHIRAALVDRVIVSIVVVQYILRVIFNMLSVITPIATVIILKPMRPAMKLMFMKMCAICKSREVSEIHAIREAEGNTERTNALDLCNARELTNERCPTNGEDRIGATDGYPTDPINQRGQSNKGVDRCTTIPGDLTSEGDQRRAKSMIEMNVKDEAIVGALTSKGDLTNEGVYGYSEGVEEVTI